MNILAVSLSLPSLPTSSGSELQNSQIIYFVHNPYSAQIYKSYTLKLGLEFKSLMRANTVTQITKIKFIQSRWTHKLEVFLSFCLFVNTNAWNWICSKPVNMVQDVFPIIFVCLSLSSSFFLFFFKASEYGKRCIPNNFCLLVSFFLFSQFCLLLFFFLIFFESLWIWCKLFPPLKIPAPSAKTNSMPSLSLAKMWPPLKLKHIFVKF